MLRSSFILLIIFCAASRAQFTTPGTGVNWTPDSLVIYSGGVVQGAASNFRVGGLITIAANDRLTILPGTTIMFAGTTSGFDVNGAFIAAGTDSSRINLTSASQDSTGAFNGVTFNDSSIDSLCKIQNCNIFYAYYGMRCIGASPLFEKNLVFKCRRGIQLSSASPKIAKNIIARSFEYGITMTLGSSPLIELNDIYDNNTQNTSPKNQVSVGTQGDNSPVIRNNKIHGSTNIKTGGISVSALVGGSLSSAQILNNEIYNNSFGIALAGGTLSCLISENYIHDNTINPDFNTAGSGINVNGTSVNAPLISKNIIARNLWGVTIQNGASIQPGPNPNLGNALTVPPTEQGRNVFVNNGHDGVYYDVYNNCTNDIFAQLNDWTVYDSAAIDARVFHKADNPQLGLVKFMPFTRIVPVELLSFSAEQSGDIVHLRWETASETNAKDFLLSKSVNGASEQPLALIAAVGTTQQRQKYFYGDNALAGETIRYTLRQRDFDGTEHTLGTRAVTVLRDALNFELAQNYPNPFNPVTRVTFTIGGNEALAVTLRIFDILGREAAKLSMGELPPGTYTREVDAQKLGLASGTYVYSLEAGDNILAKKFVLEK